MLYPDYVKAVFDDYEMKKAAKVISSWLTHPTTANLRNACIAVCKERFTTRDQGILKTFFGPIGEDLTACVQTIEICNPNKFKPLVKFLKNEIRETNVKNIDLLAWLIDYKDRPYGFLTVTKPQPVKDEPKNPGVEEPPIPKPGSDVSDKTSPGGSEQEGSEKKKSRKKAYIKRAGIIVLILSVINVSAYTLWTSIKPPPENEKCMYWDDDHYQPISCNQKLENHLVIALDSQKLNHFKRITTPDTITLNSIGNVWYTKVNGNIEFYTSSGFHPTNLDLRLKPITQFIISKYIHPLSASK